MLNVADAPINLMKIKSTLFSNFSTGINQTITGQEFFDILKIGEGDSLCEKCIRYYEEILTEAWKTYGKKKLLFCLEKI